jgi:hypothetical protein
MLGAPKERPGNPSRALALDQTAERSQDVVELVTPLRYLVYFLDFDHIGGGEGGEPAERAGAAAGRL